MKTYTIVVCIHVVDGSILRTKTVNVSPEEKEAMEKLFSQIDNLEKFQAEIEGHNRYFRVENIISVWVEEVGITENE